MEEILSNPLDVAIEAHGGLKLWREIKEVELKLSLTGGLFRCASSASDCVELDPLPYAAGSQSMETQLNQLKTSYDD